MIDNLIERGLDPVVPRLFIVDGAKALSKAIRASFGRDVAIQRCQIHKARNIMERLPKSTHAQVRRVLRQAWEMDDADRAEQLLRNLARHLEKDWRGVSKSILEGLDEMLTVTRLGLPPELRRSLACTNIIENVMGTVRRVCRNVKYWRSPSMALRWTGAAMLEAAKGFRRLKACKQLPLLKAALAERKAQARTARELSKKYGVFFIQDGHTRGTVKFAHEQLNLLGPDAIFSHATDLTEEEVKLIASTGTRISHNPSAIFSIRGRNPTTELIDAGAVVMLGSDGSAPDRSYDMFRHMFQATRYHRFYFRDPNVLPAGKVLEMATIDAAKALGMEKEIGSLEAGKKADVILLDWFKPHMVPMNMPVYRVVYFAEGTDVATVIVDGKVLMRDRKVLTVNEEQILTRAQQQADLAIKRSGLESLTAMPAGFWGKTKLGK